MKRLNPDMISHSLFLGGMSAYRAILLEMAEHINEIQEAIEELQGLVSGEMMAGLVKPGELREVVAELGHGWRIERQPSDTPDTITMAGTPADSWLPGDANDWVAQFAAAVDGA